MGCIEMSAVDRCSAEDMRLVCVLVADSRDILGWDNMGQGIVDKESLAAKILDKAEYGRLAATRKKGESVQVGNTLVADKEVRKADGYSRNKRFVDRRD